MVGILVDHDLIAGPIPASDDVVIVGGDVPVEIVKPEAFPVPSRHHEYMLRSEATGEASVCKRLSHLEMRIVAATIVSDPFTAPDVHVRHVGMTLLVHGDVVFVGGRRLLSARRRRSPCGSGTAGRNMSTAHRRGATTSALV